MITSIRDGGLEVAIKVDGQHLAVYRHQDRYFVAGQPGKAYSIVVINHSGVRQEILESVDGRNVLQDEAASFQNKGMIVRFRWENQGWRIDNDRVREFVFADPIASIAAQATGSISNVGVIGIAMFREKTAYNSIQWSNTSSYRIDPDAFHVKTLSASRSADVKGLEGAASGFATTDSTPDLGTGIGQEIHDRIGTTQFVRASTIPDAKIEIQYRTEAWLREQGIIGPYFPSAWTEGTTGYGKY